MSDATFCPNHDQRERDIQKIHDTVAKHSGQWKVLLCLVGAFAGCVVTIGTIVHSSNKEAVANIEASTRRIELTFSNYMASHKAESAEGFRRIITLEGVMVDHEKRIRTLER